MKIIAYLAFFVPVCVLGSGDALFQSNFEDDELPVGSEIPNISLTFTGAYKDVDGTPGASAGDRINYSYLVTNNGDIRLTSVILSASSGISIDTSNLGSIEPGDNKTATGSHTLSQADINSGQFFGTGSVSAQCESGCPVSDSNNDTRSFARTPSIQLVNTGSFNDIDGTPGPSAGDTISYTLEAINTGNVTLTSVTLGGQVSGVTVDNPALGSIQPGTSKTGTAIVNLTQAHINSGLFNNSISVSADCQFGCPVSDSDDDTRLLPAQPEIELETSGILNDDDGTAGVSAGDTIAYSYVVSNNGNVTLNNVTLSATNGASVGNSALGSIAPGSQVSRSGSYTLVQNDVDSGQFSIAANVSGSCNTGCPVNDSDSDTRHFTATPEIAISTSASLNDDDGNPGVSAGDTIAYSFVVSNTGSKNLSNVTLVASNGVSINDNTLNNIAPGAQKSRTGTYTLTQANIDSGLFTMNATANGQCGSGCSVSDSEGDSRGLARNPSINLITNGNLNDNDGIAGVSAGDSISYSYVVSNTGNVTIDNISLSASTGVSINNNSLGSLAPGAQASRSGNYTISQADVDAGQFAMTATGTGHCNAGCPVNISEGDTQALARSPSISITTSGILNDTDGTQGDSSGDQIAYNYQVHNTGNVTLNNVYLSATGGVSINDSTLDNMAPGSQKSRTGSYIVTQENINEEGFISTANVNGQCNDGVCPVTDEDSHFQALEPPPQVCEFFYDDNDNDGFGEPGTATQFCTSDPQGPATPPYKSEIDGDCNDSDNEMNPGAIENAPDMQHKDENCDGIDGNPANAVFVSVSDGYDSFNCGAIYNPCKSIDFGISIAEYDNVNQVYIQEGTYAGPLLIEDHIFLYGGFDANWSRSVSNITKITGGKINNHGTAVEVENVTVGLQLMTLEGPDINSSFSDPNSYVIYGQSGADIFLEEVVIRQGTGRSGNPGADGISASTVRAPAGGTGGSGATSSVFCDISRAARGVFAENSCPVASSITKSGPGGLGGKMNERKEVGPIGEICHEEAEDGHKGANAVIFEAGGPGDSGAGGSGQLSCQAGAAGATGIVSDGLSGDAGSGGSFISYKWRSEQGGNGSKGLNGGGGGGGGGAGGCDLADEARGGGGGGGGAGGCQAPGHGIGGYGGGASFGIQILNGDLEVRYSIFERGQGGHGGNGGDSGLGQPGGLGGLGGPGASNAKAGGSGGEGGRGGHSGGGGGGAGGPSCGIAALSSNVIRNAGNTYSGGNPGQGGDGGAGPIPGSDGQSGQLCELLEP